MTAVETAIAQENPLSIRGALLWGAQVLRQAGLENSRLDAEVLLRHVLNMEKEQLYMNGDAPISAGQEAKFRGTVAAALAARAGCLYHRSQRILVAGFCCDSRCFDPST